jgi:hypothetical protein
VKASIMAVSAFSNWLHPLKKKNLEIITTELPYL